MKSVVSVSTGVVRDCEEVRCDEGAGVAEAYGKRGGLFESGRKGYGWLCSSGLEEKNGSSLTVSEEEMKIAYQEYLSRSEKQE